MPVVAQVSDLHLSPRVPARQAQAELVLAGINAAKPDLTVVTGDLTDDGWDRPEDLVWAKQWMDERLDGEWFAVPGNHDVGNFAGAKEGAITAERVGIWNAIFGPVPNWYWWPNENVGTEVWRVLGLNSMLFGSGLPSETNQLDMIEDQSQHWSTYSCSIAVFLHSPMYFARWDEQPSIENAYWLGPAEARNTVWNQLMHDDLSLLASGHVHQSLNIASDATPHWEETRIVWAPPASGTWVHAPGLPNPPAPERTGFVLHHLGDNGQVASEVVECASMLKTVFFDPTGSAE